ncbi:MAG: rhamnulokinase [Verrucomicrobiales bacterium]|nr:rhamnulokinase [Verrucomicrobiales bacterium]
MNSPQVFLGIDVGAESGRVMAGLWDGRRVRLEEVHRFPNGPVAVDDTLRWDLPGLWREIQCGLNLASRRYGGRLASVGVDTWALDYVLLSRSGEMLGLPFCYRDARTRGLVEETAGRVPRNEIFAATGLQFMEINTLYQWIAHHRASPEVFAAASTFQMIPDWLNGCLCGARVAEMTNATTTQFYDPERRTWARGLLERLGLPTHLLPGIVEPGTRLGTLRGSLGPTIPVIAPATHDTGSAVAGTPGPTGDPGWAYISSGTWSLVGVESKEPILTPAALAANVTNEGGVDGTWRILKNVMGLWLLQRCRAALGTAGNLPEYDDLVRGAVAAPALRSLVDPDDPRFLNPPDMTSALRDACRETGQPVPETPGALVRCVLESLALKYDAVLRQLETLTGNPLRVVHLVGGGALNALLNQFTADATGLSVVAGPVEATLLGNVLVQARTLGELGSLAELRRVVGGSFELATFGPRPGESDRWAEARERFSELRKRTPSSAP